MRNRRTEIMKKITEFVAKHRVPVNAVVIACGIILFCTVYALILPAAAVSGNGYDLSKDGIVLNEDTADIPALIAEAEQQKEEGDLPEEGSTEEEGSGVTESTHEDGADAALSSDAPTTDGDGQTEDQDSADDGENEAPNDETVSGNAEEGNDSGESVSANTETGTGAGAAADVLGDTTVPSIKEAIPDGAEGVVVGEIVSEAEAVTPSDVVTTIQVPSGEQQQVPSFDSSLSGNEGTEKPLEDSSVSENSQEAERSEVPAAEAVSDNNLESEVREIAEAESDIVAEAPVVYAHFLSADVNGVHFEVGAEDSAMLPETTKMFVTEAPADQYDLSSLGNLVYGRVFTVRFITETAAEDGSLSVSDVIPADNVQVTISTDAPALGELDTRVALDLDRNGAYVLQESTDSEFIFTAGQISTVGLFVVDGEPEVEELPVFAHELTAEVSGMTVKVEAADAAMIPEKARLVVEETAADAYANIISSVTNVKVSHFLRFSIQNEIIAEDGAVTTETILPASVVTVTVTVPDEIRGGYKKIALNPTDGSEYVLSESDANTFTFETTALDAVGLIAKSELAEKLTASIDGGEVVVEAGEDAGIPENAVLSAEEIAVGSTEYNALRNDAASKGKVGFARFFRLSLKDANGNDVIPAAPVTVSLDLGQNSNADAGFRAVLDMDNQAKRLSKRETETFTYEAANFGTVGAVAYDFLKLLHEVENDYSVTMYYNRNSGVPDGASLSVRELDPESDEYKEYRAMLVEALGGEAAVKTERLFDITLLKDGQEIEPTGYVNVEINLADKATVEGDEIKVVHFEEEKAEADPAAAASVESQEEVVKTPVEIKEVETTEKDDESVEVKFESDKFSIYVIVGMETIRTQVITAEGETYAIEVTYGPNAEIPKSAELFAEEIIDDEIIDKLIAQANEEVQKAEPERSVMSARFFNIEIKDGETIIEPKETVDVKITYVDPVLLEEGETLSAIHFGAEGIDLTDVQPAENEDGGTEIVFEQNSFSITGTIITGYNPPDGDYMILYRDGGTYYALANGGGRVEVTPNAEGQFESPTSDIIWTKNDTQWRGNQGTGNYLYLATNGSTVRANEGSLSGVAYNNNNRQYRLYRNAGWFGSTTYFLRHNNNGFISSTTDDENNYFYLARVDGTPTITVHYVDQDGNEIAPSKDISETTKIAGAPNYTQSEYFSDIYDLYQSIEGYTYDSTHLNSKDGTQITAEVVFENKAAYRYNENNGNATFLHDPSNQWMYQDVNGSTTTDFDLKAFSTDTDVYVVYSTGSETPPGGDDDQGSGEVLDEPSPKKRTHPNGDGTYEMTLSVNASSKPIDKAKGANVIVVFDMSSSMSGNNVSQGWTRLAAGREAARTLGTRLLALNDGRPASDPLVRMKVIPFNQNALVDRESGWFTQAGPDNAQFTDVAYYNGYINNTTNNGLGGTAAGTNWESAIKRAKTVADSLTDENETYIIFITDGNPWVSGMTNTHAASIHNYMHLGAYFRTTEPARQIVESGYKLYGIGMYGAVDVLHSLMNYAYTGRSTYDTSTNAYGHYYPAQQQQALIDALSDIAGIIEGSLDMAGVDFKDGIALDTTHTSMTTGGQVNGIKYIKSKGTDADSLAFTVRVGSDGKPMFSIDGGTEVEGEIVEKAYTKITADDEGNVSTVPATAQIYQYNDGTNTYEMAIASLDEDGNLDWDLSPLGVLDSGSTYTLSTTVWPDQEAYDLLTDLNNGVATWDATKETIVKNKAGQEIFRQGGASKNGISYDHIVKYPNGIYGVLSNTYQTLDYFIAETDEDGTIYKVAPRIDMPFPEPMGLDDSTITLVKDWEKNMMPDASIPVSVKVNLLRDGEPFISNIELKASEQWKTTKYIAPGMMIKKSDAEIDGIKFTDADIVSYNREDYVVLNEGHDYQFTEDYQQSFELEEKIYHPMLVADELFNIVFTTGEDGKRIATATDDDMSQGLVAVNHLKGGINIDKVLRDSDNTEVTDSREIFDVNVTLTVPMDEEGQPDFHDVDKYTKTNSEGETYIANNSVAWYTYYRGNSRLYDDDLIDLGILEDSGETYTWLDGSGNEHTSKIGNGTNHPSDEFDDYGSGYFMIDFNDTTGVANGTVKIIPGYTIRFTNMAAGTTYEVDESRESAAGYEVTYKYTHQTFVDGEPSGDPVPDDDNNHEVKVNSANNAVITNKQTKSDLIIIKADENGNAITSENNTAQFKLTRNTANNGSGAWVNAVDADDDPHLISEGIVTINSTSGIALNGLADGLYQLTETKAPAGYIVLSGAVTFKLTGGNIVFVTITETTDPEDSTKKTYTVTEIDTPEGYTITAKTDTVPAKLMVSNEPGAELPSTGGPGTLLYTLSGLVLMLGAALMYGFRMRA